MTGGPLITRREVAALPDLPGQAGPVHQMTVTKWEQAGMPVAERGRKGKPSLYSEIDVRAWLQSREDAAKAPGAPVDLTTARAEKEHWQAKVAEQTFKTRERELLPRAEVEKAWSAERDAIRTKLLAVPATYCDRVYRAATIDGLPGVERALKEVAYEVLRELAGEAVPKAPRRRRKAA